MSGIDQEGKSVNDNVNANMEKFLLQKGQNSSESFDLDLLLYWIDSRKYP